ncbi:MAG: hypothetical protein ACSHWZ_18100 [Sulfitobacter sp.]
MQSASDDHSKAPFMPEQEVSYLTSCYEKARVILEYGSGGSTRIASKMSGKLIFSVESDYGWANALQEEIDASAPRSPAIIYHSDIGTTGPWGRPISMNSWRQFFRYPYDIWEEPFFRHPDTVLIDGRMRTACLVAIMIKCEKPVTVLFDDYVVRPMYSEIEKILPPAEIVGRMACFKVDPGLIKKENISFAIKQFAMASVFMEGEEFYHREAPPW